MHRILVSIIPVEPQSLQPASSSLVCMSCMINDTLNHPVLPEVVYRCQVCIHGLTVSLQWRSTQSRKFKVNKREKMSPNLALENMRVNREKVNDKSISLFLLEPEPKLWECENSGSVGCHIQSSCYTCHKYIRFSFQHAALLKTSKEAKNILVQVNDFLVSVNTFCIFPVIARFCF